MTSLSPSTSSRVPASGYLIALFLLSGPAPSPAEEVAAATGPETTVEVTGFYYAMRDQADFASGVVSVNRGALHLEARYNYEDRNAGSAFLGWTFAGGDELTFEATPIVGVLFGSTRGAIPGLEASIAYGQFDASIEAEYVHDLDDHAASYFYTWNELGWSPTGWLRVGLAGQRTRTVQSERSLERGLFGQVNIEKLRFGVYAFNPDLDSRYVVAMFGIAF